MNAARMGSAALTKAQKQYDRLSARFQDAEEKGQGDKAESLAIQLEGSEFKVGRAFSPILGSLAQVHMLCAFTLESYINYLASERFAASVFDSFDKLTLEGKYQLLPALLGKAPLEPGREPLQSVSRILKLRNALVHYKPKKEDWTGPAIPESIKRLGLTFDEARVSLDSVGDAVRAFATAIGEDTVTGWLSDDESSCFGFFVEE